jgi:hypothetical protein
VTDGDQRRQVHEDVYGQDRDAGTDLQKLHCHSDETQCPVTFNTDIERFRLPFLDNFSFLKARSQKKIIFISCFEYTHKYEIIDTYPDENC